MIVSFVMTRFPVLLGLFLLALLSLVFGILRLTGVIDWGLVWILAPVWMPLVFIALIALVSNLIDLM